MFRFIFAAAVAALMTGCAQRTITRTPVDITIDLTNKTVTNMDDLQDMRPGNFYRVNVTGINSNVYKVQIGNADSSTSEGLTFPTFATLPIEGLQKAVAALPGLGQAVAALAAPLSDTAIDLAAEKMMEDGKKFKGVYRPILRRLRAVEFPKAPAPTPEVEVRALLLGAEKSLENSLFSLQTYNRKIDSVLLLANQAVLNAQVVGGTTPFGPGITPSSFLQEVTALRLKLDSMSRWVKKAADQFEAAKEPYVAEIEGKAEFKSLDAQLKKSFAEFEPAIAAVKTRVNAENAAKVFLSFISVVNTTATSFTSLPMQFTRDEARLDVAVIPRNENLGLQSFKTTLVFPTETYDSFWGLSSSFYVSTPANEAYSTQVNIGTDTTYSLVSEKPGDFEIGFNTMLRYGRRLKNNTYWQIGIGPGVSVSEKVRPRMLLGTGFAFGERHALLVDAGVIAGYYDVRSEVFASDGSYRIAPAQVIKSKLKTGFYFSIGYLFLK